MNEPPPRDNSGGGDNSDIIPVSLITNSGEPVGTLSIPEQLAASGPVVLEAVFVNHVGATSQDIGSSIVDITITDALGNIITELEEPLEICLEEDSNVNVCFFVLTSSSLTPFIRKIHV